MRKRRIFGIGHFLGGPGLEYKSTLAIGSLARNIGLALLITTVNEAMVDLLPTIITFLLIGIVSYFAGMSAVPLFHPHGNQVTDKRKLSSLVLLAIPSISTCFS